MKTRIFSLVATALVLFACNSYGQMKAGDYYVGGGLSLMSSNVKEKIGGVTYDVGNSFEWSVLANAGYFVTDKLALGLQAGFSHFSLTSESYYDPDEELTEITSLFSASPYARYFLMFSERVGFIGTLGMEIGTGNNKEKISNSTDITSRIRQIGVGLTPGLAFFPSHNISLEATFGFLGYVSEAELDPDDDDRVVSSSWGLSFNSLRPGLQMGFSYHFTE
ncbi:MAG: outer membrane beta-barrel protein [Chitinophagales bacterium]|nr:porin family protein [Chitinophagales bacterium]MDW8394235.1 outer membrane beta-barrel protein [Chitinophagales bacterium]